MSVMVSDNGTGSSQICGTPQRETPPRPVSCATVKKLTVFIAAVVVLSGAALLAQHGRATAYAPPNHRCSTVPSLNGLKRGYPILIQTLNVSCAQALIIVQAKESGIGVTFVGNPEGPASQFRWKLYGLPGWTCYGDGSGFPGHGVGGSCTRGSATVQWYHA
jgi:hypothetical protein